MSPIVLQGSWIVCLVGALCCAPVLLTPDLAHAQPYSSDTGPKHGYGPDHQGQSSKMPMTGSAGRIDAYGNPIVPLEEEEAPSRRLRHGAYGGQREEPQVRPLPDGPEQDAGWNF